MSKENEFPREPTYSHMHLAAFMITTPYGYFATRLSEPPPVAVNFPLEPHRRYLVAEIEHTSEVGEWRDGKYNGLPLRSWRLYELRPEAHEAEAYDQKHGRWWIKEGRTRPD